MPINLEYTESFFIGNADLLGGGDRFTIKVPIALCYEYDKLTQTQTDNNSPTPVQVTCSGIINSTKVDRSMKLIQLL